MIAILPDDPFFFLPFPFFLFSPPSSSQDFSEGKGEKNCRKTNGLEDFRSFFLLPIFPPNNVVLTLSLSLTHNSVNPTEEEEEGFSCLLSLVSVEAAVSAQEDLIFSLSLSLPPAAVFPFSSLSLCLRLRR